MGVSPFAMDWRGSQVLYASLVGREGRPTRSIAVRDVETGEDRVVVDTLPRKEKPSADQMARTQALSVEGTALPQSANQKEV